MKKNYKKSRILGGVALLAFGAAMLLMIFGMCGTMGEIKNAVIARTPDAILASAGVTDGKTVSLPVNYYDQKADECVNLYDLSARAALKTRQFGWTECGYLNKDIEQGMVDFYLDGDYLPVALGGKLTSNRGVIGGSSEGSNFARWFKAVDGLSAHYAGVLKMDYREADANFSFFKSEFYPLDSVESAWGEVRGSDGHNHLFTMNFAVPFTVLLDGYESVEINADDDTFVFVGNELVIDMGGIHEATTGRLKINESGEVYSGVQGEDLAFSGVTVAKGETSIVRIFHADRDSADSTFNIQFSGMNLAVTDAKLAEEGAKDDDVQIAYDPTDPSYMPPLGESSVAKPDAVNSYVVLVTVEGAFVVVFALLLMVSIRFMVRGKREARK